MTAVRALGAGLRTPEGAVILHDVTWTVTASDRWVIVGPNGSGKTSLLRLVSAQTRPSFGTIEVLGERLGRTDMRELRKRIGVASAAVADQLRPGLSAHDAVVTAHFGALEPWWHEYPPEAHQRAEELLATMGCADFASRPIQTLSQGERQRVLLARALMPRPGLVLLDEPAAGLDLPAREGLVARIASLASDAAAPPMVLVTHHVEEIPPGMTHALALRDGGVVEQGRIDDVLTGDVLSAAFGLTVKVERREGRWAAWAH
jgi:iron complex transport system ATP-binding protein